MKIRRDGLLLGIRSLYCSLVPPAAPGSQHVLFSSFRGAFPNFSFGARTSVAERPPLSGQAVGHSVGKGTRRGGVGEAGCCWAR